MQECKVPWCLVAPESFRNFQCWVQVYISERWRFIYIRQPKSSSTAVLFAIRRLCLANGGKKGCERDQFRKVAREEYIGDETWKDFFVFTFIRNPWTRLLSGYKMFDHNFLRRCVSDAFLLGMNSGPDPRSAASRTVLVSMHGEMGPNLAEPWYLIGSLSLRSGAACRSINACSRLKVCIRPVTPTSACSHPLFLCRGKAVSRNLASSVPSGDRDAANGFERGKEFQDTPHWRNDRTIGRTGLRFSYIYAS